jgi:hypothetical protein
MNRAAGMLPNFSKLASDLRAAVVEVECCKTYNHADVEANIEGGMGLKMVAEGGIEPPTCGL